MDCHYRGGEKPFAQVSMQTLVSAHAWIKSPSADVLVKKMVEKSLF